MSTINKSNIHHIYYKKGDSYRIYDPYHKEFYDISSKEILELTRRYEMFAGYEASDIGLFNFYKDFKTWNKELLDHYNKYKTHLTQFTFYYSNELAVFETFYRLSDKNVYDIKNNNFARINGVESLWFESCHNGGLAFCKPGTYECKGYDHNSFYPRMLGDSDYYLRIPINKGYESKILSLPNIDDIPFGFYNVKIECNNENFNKMFAFSKKNVYTHYSLGFALKHKTEFNIKIEMIEDVKYNCYLYNNKDIIHTRELFHSWFDKLIAFKNKHPKNKLIKHMLSSLWGSLCRKNKIIINDDELLGEYNHGSISEDTEYILDNYNYTTNNVYYTLLKRDDQYKYNLRLKPFLLSYSRNIMGTIAYENHLNEIVRVFADNIVYKSDVTLNIPHMTIEDKTTGHINFKNVMRYTK